MLFLSPSFLHSICPPSTIFNIQCSFSFAGSSVPFYLEKLHRLNVISVQDDKFHIILCDLAKTIYKFERLNMFCLVEMHVLESVGNNITGRKKRADVGNKHGFVWVYVRAMNVYPSYVERFFRTAVPSYTR